MQSNLTVLFSGHCLILSITWSIKFHFIMCLNLFCYFRLWDPICWLSLMSDSFLTCQDEEFFHGCLYWTVGFFYFFGFEGRVLFVCFLLFCLFSWSVLYYRVHIHCFFCLVFVKATNESVYFISKAPSLRSSRTESLKHVCMFLRLFFFSFSHS